MHVIYLCKHKNDVFRLTYLITSETRLILEDEIYNDMKNFLSAMENEKIDLKSLGIKGASKEDRINILYECYGIIK